MNDVSIEGTFAQFVNEVEARLSRALIAAYGHEVGRELTRDVLAYAWEHWSRVSTMENPTGYLYRVAQSRSRWYLRRQAFFPEPAAGELPHVEPGLATALARLSPRQRVALVLIHVDGMTEREAAEAMGLSRATVRRHAQRGMDKLRNDLEVDDVE